MTAAMYSAIGGLKTHMSSLGVIGNNIANVNTQAYKAQRMTFQESMYTTSRAGSNGTVSTGGNTPSQIGYGATVGSIDLNMAPSTYSPTGYGLDCMLDGEGFFIVGDKDTGKSVGGAGDLANFELTRMGDFFVDPNGYVCDRRGKCVYGFATVQNPDYNPALGESKDNPKTITSTELVPLRLPLAAAEPLTGQSGWEKNEAVYNILSSADTDNNNARSNFSVGALVQNAVEIVRRQLASPNGVTANNHVVQVDETFFTADELRDLGLTNAGHFTVDVTLDSGDVNILGVGSVGLPTGYDQTNNNSMGSAGAGGAGGTQTQPAYTWPIPNAEDKCIKLTGMSVSKEGAIIGTNEANGQVVTVGYVAVVNAATNEGVTHVDGYYYKAMEGAGDLQVSALGNVLDGKYMNNKFAGPPPAGGGAAGQGPQLTEAIPPIADSILGGGKSEIRNGGLEQSSTDIANEFANMILTQRGYQANTRIITVTDSMLEELVNMKR